MSIIKIGNAVICSTIDKEVGFRDYRFAAKAAAEEMGLEVFRNNEDKGLTQEMFETVMKEKAPIFIAIIGEKITPMVIKEYNLALKLNLPIITYLKTNKNREPTKQVLKNIETISPYICREDCCLFYCCEDLYVSLKERLSNYLNQRVNEKIVFLNAREDIYHCASEMISKSKEKVILCQNSSILLLGPRAGGVETICYNKIIDWVKQANEKMQFFHMFSFKNMARELEDKQYTKLEETRKIIKELLTDDTVKANICLYSTWDDLYPYVIADNNILLSLLLGDEKDKYYANIHGSMFHPDNISSISKKTPKNCSFFLSNSNRSSEEKNRIINLIDEIYSMRFSPSSSTHSVSKSSVLKRRSIGETKDS